MKNETNNPNDKFPNKVFVIENGKSKEFLEFLKAKKIENAEHIKEFQKRASSIKK